MSKTPLVKEGGRLPSGALTVARRWGNIAREVAGPTGYWLVLVLITFLGMNAVIRIEATETRLFLVVVVFGVAFGAASLVEHLLRIFGRAGIRSLASR
jgi:type IV secretory pathway VirB2 component (pilin)